VRLLLVIGTFVLAAPAAAQIQVGGPPPAGHPLGVYAGVEPGEAVAPPALRRLARLQQRGATIVTWPGFQPLGDGSTRFFVQTTAAVAPELRLERGRVVILFRNTTIHVRNSGRWLETRFFNTPVARARLERRRRDMALVLYMRAAATPRVSTAANGPFHYTYVDFDAGVYAAPAGRIGYDAPSSSEEGPPEAPMREIDPALPVDDERPPGFGAGE
jgi:hypothetical protein